LGWIAVAGPDRLVDDALSRLELICDSYLSVSTPVQVAAPALIEMGRVRQTRIAERVRANSRALGRLVSAHPSASFSPPEGGWSAVVQVPATRGEEALVLALLDEANVLVHPGYFFDFPREAYLIVSLLPEPAAFAGGIERMLRLACGER